MSLSDLKKQANKPNQRKKLSVDQFIEDADNYAQGRPSLSLLAKQDEKGKPIANFRHCTFTFDNRAVNNLQRAALQHQIAKSKLLRVLIKQFSSLSIQQQQDLLKRYQDG